MSPAAYRELVRLLVTIDEDAIASAWERRLVDATTAAVEAFHEHAHVAERTFTTLRRIASRTNAPYRRRVSGTRRYGPSGRDGPHGCVIQWT